LIGGGIKLIKVALILVVSYVYLQTVLALFPWTRWFASNLLNQIINPLTSIGAAIVDYLPKLLFLVILILITRYILKLTRVFFDAIATKRLTLSNFEVEWAWPTYRIVRFIVVAFAVVVAYPYIPGSDSAAFKGVSLFLGVLFSLGSTSVIANVIAGYTMTYRRAFGVGDWIKIDGVMGEATKIRLLVTHFRTFKNEEVIVPNAKILSTELTNFSSMARDGELILHTTVGIGYEVPWRQVEAMLLMAAAHTPGLRADRQAFVEQKSLGDFAVNYELNVHRDNVSLMPNIYSKLHRAIQDVFNEYGVQIMTPLTNVIRRSQRLSRRNIGIRHRQRRLRPKANSQGDTVSGYSGKCIVCGERGTWASDSVNCQWSIDARSIVACSDTGAGRSAAQPSLGGMPSVICRE
jgi:small-conductance mechanosensitive channel